MTELLLIHRLKPSHNSHLQGIPVLCELQLNICNRPPELRLQFEMEKSY